MAATEVVRAFADLGPAAVWLGGAMVGLMAVFMVYVGVALAATLKADKPELQQYRYQALHDLLEVIRELFRGRGTQ